MVEGILIWELKEQIIFPEIDIDKVNNITGMDITFVTSANTDDEAKALLDSLRISFYKKIIRMAKESMKARERKREKLVARYEAKREELDEIRLKSTDASDEAQMQMDAMMQIQKLPANSSKIRKHNRCGLTEDQEVICANLVFQG